MARSVVKLPAAVRAPFDVYLNGVRQEPGIDFRVQGRKLVFERELKKDRISGWRWFLGAWGVGTYRQDDSVDVRYERADGSPAVAEGSRSSLEGSAPSRSHGRRSLSALRIARVAGRAVERVEVDPGRAAGQQLGALQRRVGDAEVVDRLGLVAAVCERSRSAGGIDRAAQRGDPLELRDVRDRHDPRDDRHVDADVARARATKSK